MYQQLQQQKEASIIIQEFTTNRQLFQEAPMGALWVLPSVKSLMGHISRLMQNSIFFCNLILIQIFKIIFRREDPSPRPFSILSPLNYHNCQSQISFPSIMGYHTKPSALKLDLYASNDYYIFSILVFKLSITYYWPSQFISFSM